MNIAEIQKVLRKEKLDGWLLYDFRNHNPVARKILGRGERIASRRAYYFIPSNGDPVRIVHAIESNNMDHLPGSKIVFRAWQDLHRVLKEALQGSNRIAMEYSPENDIPYIGLVDAGTIELVSKCGVEVVSSADLVQIFESCWNEAETRSHFDAVKLVDEVKDAGFSFITENIRAARAITEYDVQQYMWKLFEERNLTADHPAIVAVNAHASQPHFTPEAGSSAAIREGDLVLIDIWGKLQQPDSIYGDITWMGYVGKQVPGEYQDIFRIVKEAQHKAFDLIASDFRRSVPTFGWQADQAARSHIAERGYGDYFLHRTGHNIGYEVHGNGANLDNLETRDRRKLIPGTGFSIEPGIYLPDYGFRSEVDVYIGDNGPVITSPEQHQILSLL